jgi:DNA-binding Xre family transcriptional regulator
LSIVVVNDIDRDQVMTNKVHVLQTGTARAIRFSTLTRICDTTT